MLTDKTFAAAAAQFFHRGRPSRAAYGLPDKLTGDVFFSLI